MASEEEEVTIPLSLQECFPAELEVEKMATRPPWVTGDDLEGTKMSNHTAQVKMEESPACEDAQRKDTTGAAKVSCSELKNTPLPDAPCWDDLFSPVEKATNAHTEKWAGQFMPGFKEEIRLEDRDVGDYGKAAEVFEVASVDSPKADGLPLDPDQKQLCLEVKEESLLDDGNSLGNSHVSENDMEIPHPEKTETEEPLGESPVVSVETFPLICKEGDASNGQMPQKPRGKPTRKRDGEAVDVQTLKTGSKQVSAKFKFKQTLK
ncbi:UNVERIFIED_CONTAM: hypothetical protein K2H54_062642 [Gekko kuhli]